MATKFSLVQKSKVVSGAGSAGTITSVLDENSIPYVEFDEVTPEPPDTMVDRGARFCREAECDCVIAIGGGAGYGWSVILISIIKNSGRLFSHHVRAGNDCSLLRSRIDRMQRLPDPVPADDPGVRRSRTRPGGFI